MDFVELAALPGWILPARFVSAALLLPGLAVLFVADWQRSPRKKTAWILMGLVMLIPSFASLVVVDAAKRTHANDARVDRDRLVAEQISETYGLEVAVEDLHYPGERPSGYAEFGTTVVDGQRVHLVWEGKRMMIEVVQAVEAEKVEG